MHIENIEAYWSDSRSKIKKIALSSETNKIWLLLVIADNSFAKTTKRLVKFY